MGFRIVGDLITHARHERKAPPVLQIGMELTFDAQENVTLHAPMVGEVARLVLDHAHADASEVLGSPVCAAALALVLGRRDLRPVGGSKRDVGHLHE